MLSNEFNKPLRLRRKTSRILTLYLLLIHTFGVTAVFLAGMPPSIKWLAMIAIIFSGVYYFRFYFPKTWDENKEWVWQKDDLWVQKSKTVISYWKMQQRHVSTPWFIITRLKSDTGKMSNFVLVKDQVDENDFRRLRVRLKYYQGVAIRIEDTAR